MHISTDNRLKKLIVIGDRLLIKPTRPDDRTASGLYLPPGVQEREKVQQGYVIKTGPGYAIPMPVEEESWKPDEDKVKYIPLQAKEGDLAIFLLSAATEVMYENEKYFIVPQSAILMLERDEDFLGGQKIIFNSYRLHHFLYQLSQHHQSIINIIIPWFAKTDADAI